jgi:uncharacterized protein (DUF427 family)
MSDRPVRLPDESHPIEIEAHPGRVVITVAGRTVADSRNALTLREADYPAVHYIPFEDVDTRLLLTSRQRSYCAYKGDCSYFDIPHGGERARDAAWTYATPHPALSRLAGHIAFYPERVDAIETVSGR